MTRSSTDAVPNPHATAEQVEAARHDSKLAQVLYHDWEAENYDEKWSISYDQRCVDYARGRFDADRARRGRSRELPYDRALELGCGTGFFLLNLIQSGVARRGSVTDLSPGMVKVATRNGQSLGLDIDGRVADAEGIPYEDNTFDLVVGHAVLHHIPDVELSLREVIRVLRPGGRFVFAGEPTNVGDGYARTLSTLTWRVPPTPPSCRDWAAGGVRRPSSTSPPAPRRWRRSSTCTPSRPMTWSGWPPTPAPSRSQTASEEFTAAMLGLAGAHLRSAVPPGRAGLGLGEIRLHRLEDAELGGRQHLAARGARRAGSTT